MAKRFTDTEIWKKQRWFRRLSPTHKLAFIYIKDVCNHAGIWKIDCAELMEDTGIVNFNLNAFIKDINTDHDGVTGGDVLKERVVIVGKKNLLITGFMKFQYERSDFTIPKNNVTESAVKILTINKIVDEGLKKGWFTLWEGYGKGEGIGIGKGIG